MEILVVLVVGLLYIIIQSIRAIVVFFPIVLGIGWLVFCLALVSRIQKYLKRKGDDLNDAVRFLLIILPLLLMVGVPAAIYWGLTAEERQRKAEKAAEAKAAIPHDRPILQQLAAQRMNALADACRREAKLTVWQKLPNNAFITEGTFNSYENIPRGNGADSFPFQSPSDPQYADKIVAACRQSEPEGRLKYDKNACESKYRQPIGWVENSKEIPDKHRTWQRDANDHIQKYDADYHLQVDDVSTLSDRRKGIRRGRIMLVHIQTERVMSEYIGFEVVPFRSAEDTLHYWTNQGENKIKQSLDGWDCMSVAAYRPTGNQSLFWAKYYNQLTDKPESVYHYFYRHTIEQ